MSKEDSLPTLLMIGHMYATAFNRRKLNALADSFRLVCVTWELEEGELFGRPLHEFEKADHQARYELIRLRRIPRRAAITRYVHEGLGKVLHKQRFDLVLVDSEPWGWIRWQAWALTRMIQPEAVFGEFTWENVKRPGWKGIVLGWIYRAACRTHDFSISGNQACRRILQSYGLRPGCNLVAAQLGVAMDEFRPADPMEKASLRARLNLPIDAVIVGFCGRLALAKGVPELLSAFERIWQEHADRNPCLVMLGSGELLPIVEASAKNRPWLKVLPPCSHREVAVFMRCLDLFVLPSKPVRRGKHVWEEQFGHVLIEAMAAQVATLGSSSGAIPEVLGMVEAVFEHSDVDALDAAIWRQLANPREREQLAIRQRERVAAHFSHESLAKVWGDFLLEQLRRHSCSGKTTDH